MITKCLVCNKSFTVYNYQLKRGNGKYCSIKCWGVAQRGTSKETHPNRAKSGAKKGHIPWCTGLKLGPLTEKHKEKLRKANKGRKISEEQKKFLSNSRHGKDNPGWKGDKVSNSGLHDWIKKHKPKSMFCEKCGKVTDKLDCANISGQYKRDIGDFRWLCRVCHFQEDKVIKKSWITRRANLKKC